ncbi:protein lin-9 homolog [Rhagoletis pomonella]|uniref:protein lin-9 homolog n=1 Tax=Rhagoletis pomonella TaxID=28610 RepID=UPI0017824079|nr:protein lin-9 homolog [Rhagoletis pomonella]XP_036318061.1 protein lin-9 homolog [Rhagoletis pomonella]
MSDESETLSKKSRKPSSPAFSDDEHIEPPAFSLATLGLRRVGSAPPPKPQPQQPIQMLNARGMPARIRKRNRFFFDDDIINDDKPLRMSLSPRKMPHKASVSPHKTPTKVLKKRTGVVSRYMRSEEKKKSTEVTTPTRSSHTSGASSSTNTTPKSSTRHSGIPIATSSSSGTVAHIIPADKKIGQSIGLRLRNLLKLPKAHRWVIFEWFYSFLDKALFEGENDFQVCLSESFPNLCTRQLNRAEWRKIRALMGKPRRCSQAFFEEERRELESRRQKIRYIQSRRSGDIKDLNFVRDLPEKIPLPLPIGTKVTARLRVPQDGIFSGTVDAYDSMNSTYRITFDRSGLGTHSIPDFEIVSENFHEMLPLQSITRDSRPNLMSIFNGVSSSPLRNMRNVRSALNMNLNKSDPVLAQEVIESPFKDPVLGRDNINGYPVKLLETLVRLKRALASKRSKLQRLSEMNNEAELKASQQLAAAHNSNSSSDESQNTNETVPQLSEEFQRRYASIVISMEKMNRDMQDYLNDVQAFAGDLTRDPQVQAMLAPSYLREKCREAAEDAVQRNNQGTVKNKTVLGLIKNLATVLLVASHLGNDGNSAEVSKVLEGCIEEVRSSLCGVNVETFQKNVQIHLHHVRMLAANNSVMMGNSTISTAGGPDR